ncbi:MAG TPA: hypothetical protein VIG42_02745, partial [Solirubrobacteraceae bacterium]
MSSALRQGDPPPPVAVNGAQPSSGAQPRKPLGLGRLSGSSGDSPTDGPGFPEGGSPARRPLRRSAPMMLPPALLAVASILVDTTASTVIGVTVLAGVAAVFGWLLGEDRRKALQREVDERNDDLRRALSELEIAQTETVRRLSMAVEFRDEDTGAHIERIGRLSTLL